MLFWLLNSIPITHIQILASTTWASIEVSNSETHANLYTGLVDGNFAVLLFIAERVFLSVGSTHQKYQVK